MSTRRGTSETALLVAAAAVLIVAATVMPLSTYRDVDTHATTSFRGGGLGLVLAGIAAAVIVMSLSTRARSSKLLGRVQLALGCAPVVVAFVLVLSRIKDANDTVQLGASKTSFALGSAVVVAAAAVIAAMSFARATDSSR